MEPVDPENPMQMDHILEALGAEVLSWPYKTDCCGGSLALTRTDLVLKLSRKLLDMALTVEADAMVTLVPHVPGEPGHPTGGHLAGRPGSSTRCRSCTSRNSSVWPLRARRQAHGLTSTWYHLKNMLAAKGLI